MKIPLRISISRPQGGKSEPCISIEIQDQTSRVQFLKIEVSLAGMMEALTGLHGVPCSGEVVGLECIGKTRVTENRSVVCPLDCYEREKLRQWLVDNCQEEGWLLNSYLGSQGSVSRAPDGKGQLIRYSVTKYVDQPENERPC